MPGRFKYEKLPKYPHMKPEDIAGWERYIGKFPNTFETCDYAVRVGEGAKMPESEGGNFAEGFNHITKKEIDVIAYKGEEVWVIEIKPVANMRSLGQILTYAKLAEPTIPSGKQMMLAVVCETVERELEDIFLSHSIRILTA